MNWPPGVVLCDVYIEHNGFIQDYSGRGHCLTCLNFQGECGAPYLFQYKFIFLPKRNYVISNLLTFYERIVSVIKPFVSSQYSTGYFTSITWFCMLRIYGLEIWNTHKTVGLSPFWLAKKQLIPSINHTDTLCIGC